MADLTEDQLRQQEDEEFEFRARAEQEARARAQQNAPAAASAGNGPIAPQAEPNLGEKVIGAAQVPFQIAAEHPVETGIGLGAAKALHLAGKYVEGQKMAANAANAVAQTNAATSAAESASKQFTSMLGNYSKMNNDIRQYQKLEQQVPQSLLDAQARLGQQIELAQSKLPGYNPNIKAPTAPTSAGPVAPEAPAAPRPMPSAAPVAQAAEQPGMINKFGQLASKYGSALAESPLGKTLGGVARIAGSAPVQGAMLALHSGDLNTGEAQAMAQIHQFQNNFAKLPPAQQSAYFNLPHDKQIQVHAMIRNGQDPSSILGQTNAMTSGYSQELQRLAR